MELATTIANSFESEFRERSLAIQLDPAKFVNDLWYTI